jgi:predicted peptidase
MKIKAIFLFILTLALSYPGYAQSHEIKITTKSKIRFWQYLPAGYDTLDHVPTIIFLHGLGEKGDSLADMELVLRHGPPKEIKTGKKFDFIVISPQLKKKSSWSVNYIDEVIEYCKSTLKVDENRLYLTGLSLGGGGVWGYIQNEKYGKKIAAAAAICGASNDTTKAKNIVANHIPVWAFHGDKDTTVPWSRSKRMVDAINRLNPEVAATLSLYEGVGHSCYHRAYATNHQFHQPNLYEWFLQYKRTDTIPVSTTINLSEVNGKVVIYQPDGSKAFDGVWDASCVLTPGFYYLLQNSELKKILIK